MLYSARLPHLRVYASKRRCLFEASAPCPAACGRAATLRLRAKSFLRLPNRELCETEKNSAEPAVRHCFLLFLGFFGGTEGLQALLDEVGDGAAADTAVKVVALEVEIRGVVVLIADGLDNFLEGARLRDLAEGVDVLDALARDVLDAQTAAVVRHQPALAAELLDGEADGNTAHAVFRGELAPGEQGAGLVFSVENLALQLQIDADGDGLLAVLFVIIGGAGDGI